MTHKEYNGWYNYEAWAVALWLDNEESSQTWWTERAEELVKENHGDKDEAVSSLEDELKDQHEEANPLSGQASVFSDLMSAALSEVNWREIAHHYIDEVETEEEAEKAD